MASCFLMYMRYGIRNIYKHLTGPLMVGSLLALFNYAGEASGFNRFLSKKDIEEGKGIYADIDNEQTTDDKLKEIESNCDPFMNSLGYVCMFLIALFVIYKILKMFIATYYGYTSGNFDISKINYSGLSFIDSNNVKFIIEVLAVALLNYLAPMISPLIRGEEYKPMTYIISSFIFIISVCLQLMFQWSGLYGNTGTGININQMTQL